jgi:hypothetical protein
MQSEEWYLNQAYCSGNVSFSECAMCGSMCGDVWINETVMLDLVFPSPQVLLKVRLKSQLLQEFQVSALAREPQPLQPFPVHHPPPIFQRSR